MKKLMSLLLVLICIVSLTACSGGSGSKSALIGTYSLKSIEASGITVDVAEAADLFGGEFSMTLELKDGGKFSLSANMLGESETTEGEWSEDGNTVTLTAEGENISATVDGSTMKLDLSAAYEGMIMVLEKN